MSEVTELRKGRAKQIADLRFAKNEAMEKLTPAAILRLLNLASEYSGKTPDELLAEIDGVNKDEDQS